MVLLPLAMLLLLSRPTRLVQWIFTGIAVTVAVWWLLLPGGLSDQTAKAWTLIASTLFAVYALGQERPATDSAIGGSLLAAMAVLSWYAALHISPSAVITEAQHGLWQLYRQFGDAAPAYRQTMTDAADAAGGFTLILPGVMVLAGMSGLLVAWRWYHIVAEAPVGLPPRPFREFRFTDHLVWLLALGLGGTVAQMMGYLPRGDLWPANILVAAGGLYWARGAAVVVSLTGDRWPRLLLGSAIPILFLTQFADPGFNGIASALAMLTLFASLLFFGVGIADTWLDFRRRAAAASGE
jgi:hypothetical protein